MPEERAPLPWRTILAVAAVAAGAYLSFQLLRELTRVLSWLVIAGFFAVVLAPAVDLAQQRLRLPRVAATGVVFLAGVGLVSALLYVFIAPIVENARDFVDDLPGYVEDAQEGRGAIGELVERYDLEEFVRENQEQLQDAVRNASVPALNVARAVLSTVVAGLTVLVLTFLFLLRGPALCEAVVVLIPERHRARVRSVASDSAKAVSGYMLGNLLISVIAGVSTYVMLRAVGVPYPEVLALFVAFTDLIPLVGATLGAIPTIGLSFLHSTTAGIVAAIFYVVYQQFENHVLQVTVMSRTVDVNPLTVLVSVLVGVELLGFAGALLAIPVAGIIQVVARNLWDERQGRFKAVPTVGVDEQPANSG